MTKLFYLLFLLFTFTLSEEVTEEIIDDGDNEGMILEDLDLKYLEDAENPVVVVSCKDFNDECVKLQKLVGDAVESLNTTYPDLDSAVTDYSNIEHLRPHDAPVIILIKPGHVFLQFEDELELKPLRGWIYENLLPAVIRIDFERQYHSISDSDIPILAFLFMRTFDEKLMKRFEINAQAYNSDDVMFMAGSGEEFYNLIGEGKEYAIKVRHKSMNQSYYVDYNPEELMSEFFAKTMHPLYEEFSPANMKMLEGRFMLWIFYTGSFAEYDPLFIQFAIKYQSKIVVTKYDVESYSSFIKNFGVDKVPGISILHPNQRTAYPLKKSLKSLTMEDLEKYVDGVLSGKTKPYLPSRNKEEVEYNEIIADEFEEVTKSDECVFIVAGVSNKYKERFVLPVEKKYPKVKSAFMNTNYDELPPEILYDNDLAIMVFYKGGEPVYVENAFLASAESVMELIEQTCHLVPEKVEKKNDVKEEL